MPQTGRNDQFLAKLEVQRKKLWTSNANHYFPESATCLFGNPIASHRRNAIAAGVRNGCGHFDANVFASDPTAFPCCQLRPSQTKSRFGENAMGATGCLDPLQFVDHIWLELVACRKTLLSKAANNWRITDCRTTPDLPFNDLDRQRLPANKSAISWDIIICRIVKTLAPKSIFPVRKDSIPGSTCRFAHYCSANHQRIVGESIGLGGASGSNTNHCTDLMHDGCACCRFSTSG